MKFQPKLPSVDPRILHRHLVFEVETEGEALKRYRGFGAALFPRLWRECPHLRARFTFLKETTTDDVWSVCERGPWSFGIQLDPDIEVICLWNTEVSEEIGDWGEDAVAQALAALRTTYIRGLESGGGQR